MTVLSDITIADEIALGNLIEHGDLSLVGPCTYQFRPGKIVTGGDAAEMVDWTTPPANAVFVIKPGAMVWIRTRERVRLPDNMCATWWQTNTLSRKGIMLVNMSVVEPGYHGRLACLFVNFGKTNVPINPNTVVAKLLFQLTDQPVRQLAPGEASDELYDQHLYEVAMAGPPSFLNVAQLTTELAVQKEKILSEIAEDAPKRVRGAFVWAFFGLALLIAALSFVPWLQTKISPNLKESIGKTVDEHLAQRLSVALPPQPGTSAPEAAAGQEPAADQLKAILQRLDGIDAKLTERSQPPAPPPGVTPGREPAPPPAPSSRKPPSR